MSGRELSIRKLALICTLAAVAGFSAPMMAMAAETAAPATADEAKTGGAGMAPRHSPFRTINRAEVNPEALAEASAKAASTASSPDKPATSPTEAVPVVPAVKSQVGDERAAADVAHKPVQSASGAQQASDPARVPAEKTVQPAVPAKVGQAGTVAPPAATAAPAPVKSEAGATAPAVKPVAAPAGSEPTRVEAKPDVANNSPAGVSNNKREDKTTTQAPQTGGETAKVSGAASPQPNRAAGSSKPNWMGTSTTLATDWAAKSKVVIDKERAAAAARDQGSLDMGIPDDHPMVKELLAGRKSEEVTLCVAGCGSEPQIVDQVTFPAGDDVSVAGADGPSNAKAPVSSDVMCVAGCGLTKMGVVYRNPRL